MCSAVSVRAEGSLCCLIAMHHAYRQRHVPSARHLGLPSPYLMMVFTVDEPLRIARQFSPLGIHALLGVRLANWLVSTCKERTVGHVPDPGRSYRPHRGSNVGT